MDDTLPQRIPGEAMMAVGDPDADEAAKLRQIIAGCGLAVERLVAAFNAIANSAEGATRALAVLAAAQRWREAGQFGLGTGQTIDDAQRAIDMADVALAEAVDTFNAGARS